MKCWRCQEEVADINYPHCRRCSARLTINFGQGDFVQVKGFHTKMLVKSITAVGNGYIPDSVNVIWMSSLEEMHEKTLAIELVEPWKSYTAMIGLEMLPEVSG